MGEHDYLTEERWYVQSTNATPLLVVHALEGGTYTVWERSGEGHTHLIFHYKEDYGEGFYHVPSLKRIYEFFIEGQEKDGSFVERLMQRSESEAEEVYEYIAEVRRADLSALSKDELIEMFRKMCERYALTCATGHLIEGFSLNADHDIKRMLEDALEDKKRLPENLTVLTTPTERSLLAQEERDLIRNADTIRSDDSLMDLFRRGPADVLTGLDDFPALKEGLEGHRDEYFWVDASYAAAPIATVKDFIVKLQQVLKEERHEAQEDTTTQTRKDEIMETIGIDGRLKMLLEMTDTVATWQDRRKRHMLAGACYVDLLAGEVAKRFGWDHNLTRYLVTEDITPEGLEGMNEDMLRSRRDGCMVIFTRDERTLLTGEASEGIRERLQQDHEHLEEVRGTCASVGNAAGRVRVCKSQHAIDSFQEGEILVASGTRPEYVPAMKKAAAIVTDEGGITSHAAIVSRELGKPCVIGTRTATKMLKDGDFVEVKADHGIVVLMEREE